MPARAQTPYASPRCLNAVISDWVVPSPCYSYLLAPTHLITCPYMSTCIHAHIHTHVRMCIDMHRDIHTYMYKFHAHALPPAHLPTPTGSDIDEHTWTLQFRTAKLRYYELLGKSLQQHLRAKPSAPPLFFKSWNARKLLTVRFCSIVIFHLPAMFEKSLRVHVISQT